MTGRRSITPNEEITINSEPSEGTSIILLKEKPLIIKSTEESGVIAANPGKIGLNRCIRRKSALLGVLYLAATAPQLFAVAQAHTTHEDAAHHLVLGGKPHEEAITWHYFNFSYRMPGHA